MRTVELLRPVALLARFPGRPEVAYRHGDGSRVSMEEHGKDLRNPGHFRFHIPRDPRANVAIHAGDPSMRTIQIGSIFRLHDPVTQFPTEGIGVGKKIGIVAHKGRAESQAGTPLPKPG